MNTLEKVIKRTDEFIEVMPKESRKKYGQFFTSKETARFMASLFDIPAGKSLTILDPGAGTGILSAALIERLEEMKTTQKVYLICYETDPIVIPLLKKNLETLKAESETDLSYEIREENYITSQKDEYNRALIAQEPLQADLVIGNPPYKKIGKDAAEALAMPDICYGAPNLYFLFTIMALFDLKKDGQLVFIMPRSWTSGFYFARFRKKLFEEGIIDHIHLFESRKKVFKAENVLQETVILKLVKTTDKPETITLTTTVSNEDFNEIESIEVPYGTVVSDLNNYVYLTSNSGELETLNTLSQFRDTLPDLGLRMKTGLTVDFRNREALRNQSETEAVPLFYAQHLKKGRVVFPIGKENEFLVSDKRGLFQPNKNYLFMKRFTTKEEYRRLQCAIYLAEDFPEYEEISTHNKLNFISGVDRDLEEPVLYGLYVLFNSTLYDQYYRILNGSTQVNSTEINSMPVPSLQAIEKMGCELLKGLDYSTAACDRILEHYL